MQIKTKGATPIEKNVIVVDEQGNEYGATYPKRAKGLVKNGRARFVGENKICLACPPNENLEDNKMSNNKNTNETMNQKPTEKEPVAETKPQEETTDKRKELTMIDVWNQIVKLQEELVDLKSVLWNHQTINDSDTVGEDGEASQTLDTNVARMKITSLNTIFEQREKTLNSLLDFYKSMYNDLYQKEKNATREKVTLIESVYDHYLAMFAEIQFEDEAERIDIIKSVKKELDNLVDEIKSNKI